MPTNLAADAAIHSPQGFQVQLLRGLLLFSVALCTLFLVLGGTGHILLKPEQHAMVAFVTISFSLLVVVLQRGPQSYRMISLAFCCFAFALFTQTLLVAQVNELRTTWFFMPLGAAYLLMGRRAGLAMALCTIGLVWASNDLHRVPYSQQALLGFTSVVLVACFGYHRVIGYAEKLYRSLSGREALFRMLTEESSEVVWRVDRNLTLTYISPADERLRGYPADAVVGRPAEEMFTMEGTRILRAALQHEAPMFVAPVRCRDGTERWLEVSAERECDAQGRLVGHHGRSRDVTDRIRLEEELQRHRARLEELVQERTADLSVAKEAAEAAARAKNLFLSNISHELRTPLTLILGMSELARARVAEPRSQQLLDQVLTQARKLTALITDLIDYAALGARRMELRQTPLQVDALMHQVRDAHAKAAADKGLVLVLEIAPAVTQLVVLGDARRLRQVLAQLTDNAIKFTEKGRVVLRVRAPRGSASGTVALDFEVEDTGIGIEPADHWLLFNAFEQADGSATRKHEGTGLGLALCKLLVQAMDGHIEVHSQPGHGSRFCFSVRLGLPGVDGGAHATGPDLRSFAVQ